MFFVAYTTTWLSLSKFACVDKSYSAEKRASVIQIVIMFLFFGLPVLFTQIFIGQFTQRGCFVLGEMMPIAYGLGIFLLLNTFIGAVLNVYYCTFLLYYVFVAIYNHPVPPWMLCLRQYLDVTPNCVGMRKIDECKSCDSPNLAFNDSCYDRRLNNLSAALFFEYMVLTYNETEHTQLLNPPSIKFVVHLFLSVVLLCILIVKSLKDLDGAVRIWNLFCFSSLILMIIAILFSTMRLHGIHEFFNVSWETLLSLRPWLNSVSTNIFILKLHEAGNILFGSFTPVTVNTGLRTTYICWIQLVLYATINTFLFILLDFLLCRLNTTIQSFIDLPEELYAIVLYPQALGLLAATSVWSSLFFLIAYGTTLQTATLQIIIIEGTLSSEIINPSYFIYTRFFILVFIIAVCVLLGTPQFESLLPYYHSYINICKLCAVFLFLCVLVLYGFQRLSDDVFFLQHNRPPFYYKLLWFICLLTSGLSFLSIIVTGSYSGPRILYHFLICFMLFTIVGGFLVMFFKYLKMKDLLSLLRPADTWGPSDPDVRLDRRLFNPRYEVRYRRKVEKCKHKCLLNSTVLRKTMERELTLINNVMLEIEENEENTKIKQVEIEQLRQHKNIMSKCLSERIPEDLIFVPKRHS